MASQAAFEDSNIALLGSKLNTELKFDSATREKEWKGAGSKIGIEVWRIEKFAVKKLNDDAEGQFYRGDCYIVLYTYKPNKDSDKLAWNLYFWLGSKSTQDEQGTAAYKTVELDDILRGAPVQYREVEGYESDGFKDLFPALIYLDGGIASGFNTVKPEEYQPRLLQIEGKKHPRVYSHPLTASELNVNSAYILDAGLKLYQWNGPKSHPDERTEANKIIRNLKTQRKSKPETAIVDGLEDNTDFWSILGGKPNSLNDSPVAEHKHAEKHKKLWRLKEHDTSKSLALDLLGEGAKATRDLLTSDDVYLLDIGYQVYVYVGSSASSEEKSKAIIYATRYLIENKLPAHTTIARIIEGSSSKEFDDAWA